MKQKKNQLDYEKINKETQIVINEFKQNNYDKNKEHELGIDEAGRGPVLGPMVYSLCMWPIQYSEKIKKIGFQDSKQLSEEDREKLYTSIQQLKENSILDYMVEVLDSQYLSNSMLNPDKYNLNQISHDTAFKMIKQAIQDKINIKKVYIDTVGPPNVYQEKLKQAFGSNIEFVVSEKADSKFTVVSAASICAKVNRDRNIQQHQIQFQQSLGSGYPGDPKTVSWINENCDPVFALPNNLVRYSWKTIENLLQDKVKNKEVYEVEFEKKQEKFNANFQKFKTPQIISKTKLQFNFNL